MPVLRHFLGWDKPVTDRVAEFLLPDLSGGETDLGNTLIIAPTRQANRRLREALARRAATRNTGILAPRVMTPNVFLQPEESADRISRPLPMAALWTSLLLECDIQQYTTLFPVTPAEMNFDWAVSMAETIIRLRDTLAEGGYLIADVVRRHGAELEEADRWKELAELERTYLATLQQAGLEDWNACMIRRAQNPPLPKGIQRIVLAAAPDPTPLLLEALETLSKTLPVEILVHAPEEMSDLFDAWGRTRPDQWAEQGITIPDMERNLVLASGPASQCRILMQRLAEESARFGPADVAIGAPDRRLIPVISAELAARHLPVYDPGGHLLRDHPLFQLLTLWRDVMYRGDYPSISRFFRHPDVLDQLHSMNGLNPDTLLTELDQLQNEHLPQSIRDLLDRLKAREAEAYPVLGKAMNVLNGWMKPYDSGSLEDALRGFLQTLYAGRSIDPQNEEDEAFLAVSRLMDSALTELSEGEIEARVNNRAHALDLCLRHAAQLPWYPEREDALIDLEGWLELHWNDAPFLIVTGMNDGIVPDGRLSDAFLPDSLRQRLGLRTDAARLARDAYLMRAMIASRHKDGRACFIAGRTDREGHPTKPSRLLFLCDDEELLRRAHHLFSEREEPEGHYPATISFKLDPRPPADVDPARLQITQLHVTQFGGYLKCPFRFFLKHVLRMEDLDDRKQELDALDFGIGIHHALQALSVSGAMNDVGDAGKLGGLLCAELDRWAETRFGKEYPLQIGIQLDAARQRLKAAAHEQVRLVRDGWRIAECEKSYKMTWAEFVIRGRIDRIDRHQETGAVRILDYKTVEKSRKPDGDHFDTVRAETPDYARVTVGNRERKWSNLQLPLYILLLRANGFETDSVTSGYFLLPKAVTKTELSLWDDLGEAQLQSARTCAEGVIDALRRRVFWPPSESVLYDDFERLFPGNPKECVDEKRFLEFLA